MKRETIFCRSEPATAERLQGMLPSLLSNLSLGRAQIAIDQVRGSLRSPRMGTVVLVTAKQTATGDSGSEESDAETVAAVIAIQSPSVDPSTLKASSELGDMATIIHAGRVQTELNRRDRTTSVDETILIAALAEAFGQEMDRRGVKFVQWATDPQPESDSSGADNDVSLWCRGFGMQPIATLDYLNGPLTQADDSPSTDQSTLAFAAIDWRAGANGWSTMSDLITRTYVDTLDCPRLNRFRTTEQTMRGYLAAEAMDRRFWLIATDRSTGEPVGCLILATHRAGGDPNSGRSERTPPVIEIVYMGLIPEVRRRGWGSALIDHSFRCGREIGGERLILAVDRSNEVAKRLYQAAGLQTMLCEAVWCRSATEPANSFSTSG